MLNRNALFIMNTICLMANNWTVCPYTPGGTKNIGLTHFHKGVSFFTDIPELERGECVHVGSVVEARQRAPSPSDILAPS